MPVVHDLTPEDRFVAQRVDTHPRNNGDMILMPDDVLEGIGNFLAYDPNGNPIGWALGRTPLPDGRHVYVGLAPDECTRQTHKPLDYLTRSSHLVDYQITEGPAAPTPDDPLLLRVPRPEAPRIKVLDAPGHNGFPASTATSPHFVAYAYIKDDKLGAPSPVVPFDLEQGQGFRFYLPDSVPEDIHEIAILMPEPGSSRPTEPGPLKVQRKIDLRSYFLPYFDLNGPYHNLGRIAPATDPTKLPTPRRPEAKIVAGHYGSRVAKYFARIVWTDDTGQSLPGEETTRNLEIEQSERYTVRDEKGKAVFRAGDGRVRIERPDAPEGARGWKIFLYIQPTAFDADFSAGWRKVMSKYSGYGDQEPWPLHVDAVETSGWQGTETYYAQNDSVICVETDLPTQNTSGIGVPENAPEPPEPIGAMNPEPSVYYVRVVDVLRGVQSLPSPAVRVEIEDGQVFSVIFTTPHNRVANPTFVEQNPSGDPLYWTLTRTNGYSFLQGNSIVFGTFAPVDGTLNTPTILTDPMEVVPAKQGWVDLDLSVDPTQSGAPQGEVRVWLRCLDAKGVMLGEKLLRSFPADQPGQHELEVNIGSESSGQAVSWFPGTIKCQVLFRLAGTINNAQATIRFVGLRQQPTRPRRDRRHAKPVRALSRELNPKWQDAPDSPKTPDTLPVSPKPDRPKSAGQTIDFLSFEDQLVPPGFVKEENGTAVVTFPAAAAMEGSFGARFEKALGGTISSAFLKKTYQPTSPHYPFRHELGLFAKNRMGVLPASGRARLHGLCHAGPIETFAWLEMTSDAEVNTLTLDREPVAPGTASITLDAVKTNIPVNGAYEVKDLEVTAPSAPGTVSITVNGDKYTHNVGGTAQEFALKITKTPQSPGRIAVKVNGIWRYKEVRRLNPKTGRAYTRAEIAQQIMDLGFPGYRVTRKAEVLTFVANLAGPRPAPAFDDVANTGVAATIKVDTNGVIETATQLATRIRNGRYPGWRTGGTGTTVRFTSSTAGDRQGFESTVGHTGATLTWLGISAGSLDTALAVAIRIAGTVFTGWTVTRSGTTLTFTANSGGRRAAPSYRPGLTGLKGTIRTVVQGSTADLTAHVRDRFGENRHKKFIKGIGTATIFNTDVTVSGAGTDRAVVSFWASLDAAPLELVARFEDVDLDRRYAEIPKIGVFDETQAGMTWRLDCDPVRITDRGRNYYRDHDAIGRWLPQIFCYTDEQMFRRQDLLLQDAEAAVIPGATYTLGLFARCETTGATAVPARLLVIYAHKKGADGKGLRRELGEVTGAGLTGQHPWAEYQKTVTIPEDCHRVTLHSRDIGGIEAVIQEVVLSPGPTPKRTLLYAPNGSYTATHNQSTPKTSPTFKFWGRVRKYITARRDTTAPGTTCTVGYRSADPKLSDPTQPGDWSASFANPDNLPDRPFVESAFSLSGGGLDTPVVKKGAPRIEYALTTAGRQMSTFLKWNRTELPGGTAFVSLPEHSLRRPEQRHRLPSGRLQDAPTLFPAIGHQPPFELLVFNDEAKRYLEENWRELFVIEAHGQWALTIKIPTQPEFERETLTTEYRAGGYRRHAIWKSKIGACEVVEIVRLLP